MKVIAGGAQEEWVGRNIARIRAGVARPRPSSPASTVGIVEGKHGRDGTVSRVAGDGILSGVRHHNVVRKSGILSESCGENSRSAVSCAVAGNRVVDHANRDTASGENVEPATASAASLIVVHKEIVGNHW